MLGGDWYISCMSEEESSQDVLLIGLGGAGIKTVLALRALIENEELSGRGSRGNSCRLLAIDSYNLTQEYLRDIDEGNLEGIHLSQKEHLVLLDSGENPWDKVTKDAKSNIPEALKLNSQRPVIEISRSPDRSDYKAMIYVSRERMKQKIRDFLKNSEERKGDSARPIKLIIATSLIGNTGSLSYLELLKILTELSEEKRCESINAVLFGPDVFEGFFRPQTLHLARYLGVVSSISDICFKEGSERILPNQYLISLNEGISIYQFPIFTIFKETAKKLYEFIYRESQFEIRVQNDGGDSIIEMVPLDLEKCLEIKSSFVDRLRADRHFNQLVREYLD